MFWFSSFSDVPSVSTVPEWLPVDKFAHFMLFAVLAGLLYRAGLRPQIAVMGAAFYGLTDEIHQMFVPGRSPEIRDWLADVLGAIFGVWLVRFPTRRAKRLREPVE